jgi:hypothetical protein
MIRNKKPYFCSCLVLLFLTFAFCLTSLALAAESSLKIDDEIIKSNIEKAEPLISEITGLAFKDKMKYELVKRDAFRDAMAEELLPIYTIMMKGATDDVIARQVETSALGMSQSLLGKYSPLKKKLLLIPDNAQTQIERYEIQNADFQDFVFLFVAYQLVSVLDDQHFDLQNKTRSLENMEATEAIHALGEGHAVYVINKITERLKLSKTAKDLLIKSVSGITDETNPVQKQQFNLFYVKGLEFVEAIINKKGIAGVNEAFVAPPTSMRQIQNPAEYLTPSTTKVFDCTKLMEKVAKTLPTSGMQSQSAQLNSMILSAGFVSQGIPEKEANSVAGECLSGAAFSAGKQTTKQIITMATVLNFTTSEAVANYAGLSKKVEKSLIAQVNAMPNAKYNTVKDEPIKLEGFDSVRYQQVEVKVDDQVTKTFGADGMIGNFYFSIAFTNPENEQNEKTISDILTYMNKERLSMQ